MMQPAPVRALKVIEVTSRCSLSCVYCLWPTMPRPKLDMTQETWQRVLVWLAYCRDHGRQGEVSFSGVGEPTLHPQFPAMLRDARELLGGQARILFTTNGKNCTEALVRAVLPARPQVCVTNHFAHLAGPAAALYRRFGLLRAISHDPVDAAQDWAGQVQWPTRYADPASRGECLVLRERAAQVNADGTFAVCCMDGSHETAAGTVFDDPETTAFRMTPWRLCASCWQRPPDV